MIRPLAPLALVALAALLAACDTTEPATAEVTVGATYTGTTLALRDVDTDEVVFDYLAAGATIEVAFEDADSFTASLFVPYEALVASGETDDLDGDVRQALAGAYRQEDGALTFTSDVWVDSFFTDGGWSIDDDGGAIRYSDVEGDAEIVVVLTRG